MRHHGIVVLTVLLVFSLAGSAMALRNPTVEGDSIRFSLPDLDNETVTFPGERFRGKVVLVDIWGTWCPPCLSEIPVFASLQEKYGERGLVIVGIGFERDDDAEARQDRLRRAVETRGINYLILDGGSPAQVAEAIPAIQGFKGFPVEILIGRDGTVRQVKNGLGYSKRWARKLETTLQTLLDEEPPSR